MKRIAVGLYALAAVLTLTLLLDSTVGYVSKTIIVLALFLSGALMFAVLAAASEKQDRTPEER